MDSISTASSSSSSSSSFLMMIKPTSYPSFPVFKKQQIHFPSNHLLMKKLMIIKASSDSSSSSSSNFPKPKSHSFIATLKTTAIAVVLSVALFWTFKQSAKLISLPATFLEQCISETIGALKTAYSESSGVDLQTELQQKLNPKAIFDLKTSLSRKLKAGKKKECLGILHKLSSAQPEIRDWKFLAARLLNEMGNTQEAIEVLLLIIFADDIPCLLAMVEISLLVDLSALGELVKSIEEDSRESLERMSDEERQGSEARLSGLLAAQLQFLLNDVDKALRSYEELERDNPNDFRPYFCKGVIYDLIGRRREAREQFAKFRQLYPGKIMVEWYLRTPIRRTRLFLIPKEKK